MLFIKGGFYKIVLLAKWLKYSPLLIICEVWETPKISAKVILLDEASKKSLLFPLLIWEIFCLPLDDFLPSLGKNFFRPRKIRYQFIELSLHARIYINKVNMCYDFYSFFVWFFLFYIMIYIFLVLIISKFHVLTLASLKKIFKKFLCFGKR